MDDELDVTGLEADGVAEPPGQAWGGRAHRQLLVWQQSIGLVKRLYQATAAFPNAELFGLTNQIRRAAVSISANIAEGAGRGSPKDFRRHLIIARGSLSELDTLVTIAAELGYLSSETVATVKAHLDKISQLLSGLIASLRQTGADDHG